MSQGYTSGVPIDTDPTMAADSNQLVPSQAAVRTYVGNNAIPPGVGAIVNADVSATAAIARSKLAAGTAYQVVVNDSAGAMSGVSPGTAGNVLTSDGTAWASSPRGWTPTRGTAIETYYTPPLIANAATAIPVDVLFAVHWIIPYTGTLDRIALDCTGTVANAVARAGVYSITSDGYPDALLVDGGQVTAAAAAFRPATISLAVTAGQEVFLAYLGGTANANVRTWSNALTNSTMGNQGSASAFTSAGFSAATTRVAFRVARAYGSLPSTFPAGATFTPISNTPPVIGVRYA